MTRKFAALAFVLFFFLSLYAVSYGGLVQRGKAQGEAAQKAKEDEEFAKLGKARRDAAEMAYKAWTEDIGRLRNQYSPLTGYHLSVNWLQGELDLAKKEDERIAAYLRHADRMKAWKNKWLEDDDNAISHSTIQCEFFTKEAEFWLVRERRGIK